MRHLRGRLTWAGFALSILCCWAVTSQVAAQDPERVTVSLNELNDSGISGTVTLTANDGSTEVTVEITGSDIGLPIHIHANACDEAEVAPTFPLTDASGLEPTMTLVNVSLSELLATPYSIIAHQPTTQLSDLLDPSQYAACANITAAGGEAPVTGIGTAAGEIGSDRALLTGLGAIAAMLAAGGLVLRRRGAQQ